MRAVSSLAFAQDVGCLSGEKRPRAGQGLARWPFPPSSILGQEPEELKSLARCNEIMAGSGAAVCSTGLTFKQFTKKFMGQLKIIRERERVGCVCVCVGVVSRINTGPHPSPSHPHL